LSVSSLDADLSHIIRQHEEQARLQAEHSAEIERVSARRNEARRAAVKAARNAARAEQVRICRACENKLREVRRRETAHLELVSRLNAHDRERTQALTLMEQDLASVARAADAVSTGARQLAQAIDEAAARAGCEKERTLRAEREESDRRFEKKMTDLRDAGDRRQREEKQRYEDLLRKMETAATESRKEREGLEKQRTAEVDSLRRQHAQEVERVLRDARPRTVSLSGDEERMWRNDELCKLKHLVKSSGYCRWRESGCIPSTEAPWGQSWSTCSWTDKYNSSHRIWRFMQSKDEINRIIDKAEREYRLVHQVTTNGVDAFEIY
jgi:hypothetical protein